MTIKANPANGATLALHGFLILVIAALLLTKFKLLYLLNINWDEFLFASQVHVFERGELTSRLQSFHVHLFGWIKSAGDNGIEQILAAREFMFGLRLLTCACVFLIARRLFGLTGALVAVAASMAFSFVIMHGESFRADPLIAASFMVSATLFILFPTRLLASTAAGLLMALAAMISIKTAIYGPTLALILLINWRTDAQGASSLRAAIGFCVASGLAVITLYLAHSASLADVPTVALTDKLADTRNWAWASPPAGTFSLTYGWDQAWWILVAGGGIAAIVSSMKPDTRRSGLIILAMMLPLLTLSFYRNSFPYYYICLIPPASLAIGLVASLAPRAMPNRPALAALLVGLAVVLVGTRTVKLLQLNSDDTLTPQRRVLEVVHSLFPEPVPYIDRCSMVINYPKVGVFMSTLVAEKYREQGLPIMKTLIERHQPRFLLENSRGLKLDLSIEELARSPYRLLPEDHRYLQTHFVRHWGPIHVAGRQFEATDGSAQVFDLPVSGPYTLESASPIILDGQSRTPGDVVQFEAGTHSLLGPEDGGRVILRYGHALPAPEGPPPPRLLFTGLEFRNF